MLINPLPHSGMSSSLSVQRNKSNVDYLFWLLWCLSAYSVESTTNHKPYKRTAADVGDLEVQRPSEGIRGECLGSGGMLSHGGKLMSRQPADIWQNIDILFLGPWTNKLILPNAPPWRTRDLTNKSLTKEKLNIYFLE